MMKSKKSGSLAYSVERIADSKKLNAKRYPLNAKRFLILIFSVALYALNFAFSCYAQEITILYTGSTHAMIYPCSCPVESDGGVARRATLIKQLKQRYPNCLILDSGNFFAGGPSDEYTQNTQLDKQRTKVALKALELMRYDAVAIGESELNFGTDFLKESIDKTNLNFLSCNVKKTGIDKVSPYIIKEVGGLKIGIIGVTNFLARQASGKLEFSEPVACVTKAIADLREKGAGIVVVLSNLGEARDSQLINKVRGIDILISGYPRTKNDFFGKIADTLVLKPFWQGRRIGKASVTIKGNKIINYNVEELRVLDKISDDQDILSVVPQCFSDNECKKEGFIGICQNPGDLTSRCLFSSADKINLTIITSKDCFVCDTKTIVSALKKQFPGLAVSYLYYPSKKANALIKEFAISGLPVYFLGKEIEKEKIFESIKANVEPKGDFYMLKREYTGVSYFHNRENINGKFDLFISLYDKNTVQLLDMVREYNPQIHFLAVEYKDTFDARVGNLEVEEYLRAVCVQKYYPDAFWDYIMCRAKHLDSYWWQDCLNNADENTVRFCAKGSEGASLLKKNIALNRELQVLLGPVYLLDNQQAFATAGIPKKEELKNMIERFQKR